MEYIDLKEKLEKLFSEDLSNRTSLQDTRRNLFLNSEGTKIQQQLVSEKEQEITSLNLLVEKKKSILQQKDEEIESLKNQLQSLEQKFVQDEQNSEEISRLNSLNAEYQSKIDELNSHINSQRAEFESLKSLVSEKENLFIEKSSEIERISAKLDLVSESERALKQLVASQNLEIENFRSEIIGLKNQAEEISAGWQQQHEQLLIDNASLLADLAKIEAENEVEAKVEIEQKSEIETEKEFLLAELQAVKNELGKVSQQRDEKVMSLQMEITELKNQIVSLQESINLETEEKLNLHIQLEELTNLVSEKETSVNQTLTNSDEDAFIDKLLSQVNLLNEQKHTFETLFQSAESQLHEASEALTSLTQVVENQKSTISDLECTNKNIKLAQTLVLQAKDKTAAKQAINELIREIDRCIALLSE